MLRRIRSFGLPSQNRSLFHLSCSARDGMGTKRPSRHAGSILEGIEDVGPGHHHRERPQRVLDLHCALMAGEDFGKPAIGLRGFIEVGALKHTPRSRSHACISS